MTRLEQRLVKLVLRVHHGFVAALLGLLHDAHEGALPQVGLELRRHAALAA